MIGQLRGQVLSKSTNVLELDVNGVGYEIEVPIGTAFSLPETGQTATLHTHFVVREDAQLLYGFSSRADRDTFRVLIKVNGVGPKLGIAILSGLSAAELARCVELEDVSALVKLPGIGKKTAERLLIELRDKLQTNVPNAGQNDLISGTPEISVSEEAESALIALGYKPQDAAKMVKKVYDAGASVEETIKAALKGTL